ncbi:hypothetical protein PINS_up008463 [Pythium insidiosum]|nr:hypothetical protein PINS_up008463 [Pythium insidiosum]
MGKRKAFEDEIRRQRHHIGTWMKYAQWEESQHEFKRARSIFERAIDVDYKNPTIWLKYAEMEMRHKFINHARNVWDRAVTLLPRVAQFWYKYAFMEEMAGNLNGARRVFERWMEWQPDDQAWYSYIKLELRANDVERARQLYERYVACHPAERSYMKFAKWEEKDQHQLVFARRIYERALEELRDDEKTELIYVAFAAFEERCREIERARAIFKYALDRLPKEEAPQLYNAFITFEKKHGDKQHIEDVVIAKRRVVYEQQVTANPLDYDSWLEYIKLEENEAVESQAFGAVRDVYERAIANVPPIEEKQYWRRYIYLWIKYALFEELIAADESPERVRNVYKLCLSVIPHKKFTFAKIWVLFAKFLVRQRDLQAARLTLGESLGKCPKPKLFRSYIELELMMGEIDRCRKIYAQFLLFDSQNCETWQKYAQLERQVGEIERARAIYELAVKQPVLDMPEMIWKAYIDFEVENGEQDLTRQLYERLLERTKHVKVWISFAQFEAAQQDHEAAREVLERALRYIKEQAGEDKKEERVLCLETWLAMEQQWGSDEQQVQKVQRMLPRKVTKQRMAFAQDGTELGMEEYTDYIFPDDEKAQSHLKLLQAAQQWKKKRAREDDDA